MARWPAWMGRPAVALWAAVVLGIALRGCHYLRQPAVWHDEAAVLVNVHERDFAALAGPLRFSEAAPILFLWLERAVLVTLGDHLLLLRLVPFLASCLSLPLLASVARRWLDEAQTCWAVFLLAGSEQLLWHACEAKPYALDVFATLIVLWLHGRLRDRPLAWQCLVQAALAPLLLTLSYPACFVYGGLLLALVPRLFSDRRPVDFLAYGLLALVVLGTFAGVVLPVAQAQHDAVITSCWQTYFPDRGRPDSLPGWAVNSTLAVLRYCWDPTGPALVVPILIGARAWWGEGRRSELLLLLAPTGLALAAALLHRYPYGGSRVLVFVAPSLFLLAGAGLPTLVTWLRCHCRWGLVPLAVCLGLPVLTSVRSAVDGWHRADTPSACASVRQHWQPGNAAFGNDWTHLYYLRELQPDLHTDLETVPQGTHRLWLVWTQKGGQAQRHERARQAVPPGWRIAAQHDHTYTTTLLLVRDQPEGVAARD